MIKLKDLITEAPKIKKVKNVSVQYLDAEFQGETLHGFKYFKKGPWLYKKNNGEYFAVVITNKNNKYEIQLGKQKNNIQATAAVEKIIKRNLNQFESVDEGKLKLTKDKPKKITQRIYSAPKRIMTKSAYLRMPDINKKRRDGVDYVATPIGPKKTQVYLPVIFESVNENKADKKLFDKVVKALKGVPVRATIHLDDEDRLTIALGRDYFEKKNPEGKGDLTDMVSNRLKKAGIQKGFQTPNEINVMADSSTIGDKRYTKAQHNIRGGI